MIMIMRRRGKRREIYEEEVEGEDENTHNNNCIRNRLDCKDKKHCVISPKQLKL